MSADEQKEREQKREQEKKRLQELKKKMDAAEQKTIKKIAETKEKQMANEIGEAVDNFTLVNALDRTCVLMRRGGQVMSMKPTVAGGTHAFVYHDGIPVNVSSH